MGAVARCAARGQLGDRRLQHGQKSHRAPEFLKVVAAPLPKFVAKKTPKAETEAPSAVDGRPLVVGAAAASAARRYRT